MYIVGYTVNGEHFGLRSWYMDSVFAVSPVSGSKINVFNTSQAAERYYKKAINEFRKNLKKEFLGGKVWIRRVGSSKNPFVIAPFTPNFEFSHYGYMKVNFSLKKI